MQNTRLRCPVSAAQAVNLPECRAGLYFGAKQSSYFAVGKITQDQVDDYSKRKGMDKSEAERWLQSMLNYEP